MKYVVDTHTHTYASGHAYSTLMENIKWASENGIEVLATTDHGPTMPGGPSRLYFANLKSVPRILEGVIHLRGCEANIIDVDGTLDIPEKTLQRLDIILASLHDVCIETREKELNTKALINVMDNPLVDIICHTGNPIFPIDYEAVIKKAKETGKIIELNNGSFKARPGSSENCREIAKLCKKYEVPVMVNSDAHFFTAIGKFTFADELIRELDIPEKLIMNNDKNKILRYLKEKGRLNDIEL